MRALTLMIDVIKNSDETFTSGAIALRGMFGIVSVAGGIGFSLAFSIQIAQLASLLVGIAVGIATLISLIRSNRRKRPTDD